MAIINHRDIVPDLESASTPITTNPRVSAIPEPSSFIKKMDDKGKSIETLGKEFHKNELSQPGALDDYLQGALHAAGIWRHEDIDIYNKRYRFGIINPYESIGSVREYLFFTKPDLNIYPRNDDNGVPSSKLAPYLQTQPLWTDLASRYYQVLTCLQSSLDTTKGGPKDPFNHLLENAVQSNMEVPPLSAEMVETPNNMYGVGYTYRGSSEAGNDTYNFSLEFRDTKWKPVYNFFQAYEDYETLKHHGVLPVWRYYRYAKILYDQYSVYKIMVDEDGETILYAGKAYGVKSKSLPRDAFSNTDFSNGLSYSIDFEAAFYDDKPNILYEFNSIAREYYNSLPYQLDVHNHILDRPDARPAKCAYIAGLPGDSSYVGYDPDDTTGKTMAPGRRLLKLKWRGDDRV